MRQWFYRRQFKKWYKIGILACREFDRHWAVGEFVPSYKDRSEEAKAICDRVWKLLNRDSQLKLQTYMDSV